MHRTKISTWTEIKVHPFMALWAGKGQIQLLAYNQSRC